MNIAAIIGRCPPVRIAMPGDIATSLMLHGLAQRTDDGPVV